MKRLVTAIFLLGLLLFECRTVTNQGQQKTSTQMDYYYTEQDAINIISKAIYNPKIPLEVFIDGNRSKNGVEYFVVHAIMLGPPHEDGQLSFTYGWYCVEKMTGDAFEMNIGTGELVPLKNDLR